MQTPSRRAKNISAANKTKIALSQKMIGPSTQGFMAGYAECVGIRKHAANGFIHGIHNNLISKIVSTETCVDDCDGSQKVFPLRQLLSS